MGAFPTFYKTLLLSGESFTDALRAGSQEEQKQRDQLDRLEAGGDGGQGSGALGRTDPSFLVIHNLTPRFSQGADSGIQRTVGSKAVLGFLQWREQRGRTGAQQQPREHRGTPVWRVFLLMAHTSICYPGTTIEFPHTAGVVLMIKVISYYKKFLLHAE